MSRLAACNTFCFSVLSKVGSGLSLWVIFSAKMKASHILGRGGVTVSAEQTMTLSVVMFQSSRLHHKS
jgi:hypothetical protein